MRKTHKIGIVVVSIVVIVGVIAGIDKYRLYANQQKMENEQLGTYEFIAGKVLRRLKSPGSAKFPTREEKLKHIAGIHGKYIIQSWVDAQNSFGALGRIGFFAQVNKDKNAIDGFVFDLEMREGEYPSVEELGEALDRILKK